MMSSLHKQTLALAGVFQAASVVEQLAKTGNVDNQVLENMLQTILNLNPITFEDVFKGKQNMRIGLNKLSDALAKNGHGVSREVLQYAMSILTVQVKLDKRGDLMEALNKGLDRAVDQQAYFNDYLHESVISAAASCYQNSVSKLNFRIRVTGNPVYLQNNRIAEKVRAILLYGVRCALLWRRSGGRRWHLMLQRDKLQKEASQILREF